VNIDGQMEEVIMENGVTTKCMEKEYSHGLMEGNMRVSTLKIRSRV
jgi:translation initiation factor IF-1